MQTSYSQDMALGRNGMIADSSQVKDVKTLYNAVQSRSVPS